MPTPKVHFLNSFLLLCLLLSACGTGPEHLEAEAAPTALAVSNEDPINSIRNRYDEINKWLNSASLRMDSLPYECSGDPGGGYIKLFRNQGELVMLKHDFYLGDHYGATETYYLQNERPIFVFIETASWRFAGPPSGDEMAPNTEDNIEEQRFYYSKYEVGQQQQSLRCLQKEYVIRSWIDIPLNKNEIPNKVIECDDNAQEYLEKYSRLVKVETEGYGC